MDIFLLFIRLGLAAVLVTSGVAKLFDREGSQAAYDGFHLPPRFRSIVGTGLPLSELAIALLLLPASLVPVSAGLATLLFAAFTVLVSQSVARGDAVDCHCFGQLSSAPTTWWTAARNLVLTVLAAIVWVHSLVSDASPLFGDLSGKEIAVVLAFLVAAAAIAGLTWLAFNLWSQQGRLLERLDALEKTPPGPGAATVAAVRSPLDAPAKPLPTLDLKTLDGETADLASLHRDKPLILVLSDPKCAPCVGLMPEIRAWQERDASAYTMAVITTGASDAARSKAADHGIANVFLQQDKAASNALGVQGTPCAVLIDRQGRIRGEAACGAQKIRDLVISLPRPVAATVRAPEPPPSRIGQLVPMTAVTDLDGNQKFVGGPSDHGQLMVFWNPGCGFCQRMLEDLKHLEATWPENAPEVVVVSTGSAEANRAQGLRSLVVLDEGFGIGRQAGASGTPSAVMLDKGGRISSELRVGAPAILALAGTVAAMPKLN